MTVLPGVRPQSAPHTGFDTARFTRWGLLAAMVLLWGFSWPATQMALTEVPPLWLATFRFGSAAICLFIFNAVTGNLHLPRKGDASIVLSVGLCQMTAFTGLGMIAMTHADTSHSVLLAYTTPLWATLIACVVARRMPSRGQGLAVAVGILGVALVCSPLETDWRRPGAGLAAAFLLTGAVMWSGVIVHVRRHTWVSSPLQLAPWQMGLATLVLGTSAALFEGAPQGISLSGDLLAQLLFIGPLATSACFVIATSQGRKMSAFAMSNLTLGVPLIGIAASVMLLGNQLSAIFICGLGLVMLGMVAAGVAGAKTRD